MNAPKRWLDEPGSATPIERSLLRSGLSLEPPPGAQAEGWAALLQQLPPPGGGAPSGGAAPPAGAEALGAKAGAAATGALGGAGLTGAVGGGLLKSALIGAGSAVALIVGYAAVTSSTPSPPPSSPPALTAPEAPAVRAPTRGDPLLPSLPANDTTEAPSPPALASPRAAEARSPSGAGAATGPSSKAEPASATDRESRLREESQRLSEARDALRRGDAATALSRLEELAEKFPGGVLGQEREALTIEALYKSGRRESAAARAGAFLKAYPTSPHAPRLQAFTQ